MTRKELKPISSLEHLLLEYQRQGAVSNVDLALLYQTKKCLFVEGTNDRKLLPKIAERLGSRIFRGRNQVVTFEFEGVENLKLIPKLVQLFEQMIGASLTWAVLRDRDANIPEVIEAYKVKAEKIGISTLFIWESYSLENMLLYPNLLLEALIQLNDNDALSLDDVKNMLVSSIESIRPDIGGVYVTKTQTIYRDLGKDNPFDSGARDAVNFISSIQTFEQCLKYYPGKRIFGQFVQLLQQKYGINMRLDNIVAILNKDNAPENMKQLFHLLGNL